MAARLASILEQPSSAISEIERRVTAYTPNGPVQLNTMAEMKAFYEANQIDWHALYPMPLSHYQAVSGKP